MVDLQNKWLVVGVLWYSQGHIMPIFSKQKGPHSINFVRTRQQRRYHFTVEIFNLLETKFLYGELLQLQMGV